MQNLQVNNNILESILSKKNIIEMDGERLEQANNYKYLGKTVPP